MPQGNQILVLDQVSGNLIDQDPGISGNQGITDSLFNNLSAVEKLGTVVFATDSDFQLVRKDGGNSATEFKNFVSENLNVLAVREEEGTLWVMLQGTGSTRILRSYDLAGNQINSFAIPDGASCIEALPGGRIAVGHGNSVTVYSSAGANLGSRDLGSLVVSIARLDSNYYMVSAGGSTLQAFQNNDNALTPQGTYSIAGVLGMVSNLGGELYVVRINDCQRYNRIP